MLKRKNIQFYFWFLFLYSKPMIYYQKLEAISQLLVLSRGSTDTHDAHFLPTGLCLLSWGSYGNFVTPSLTVSCQFDRIWNHRERGL